MVSFDPLQRLLISVVLGFYFLFLLLFFRFLQISYELTFSNPPRGKQGKS